jgi:aminoglycoside phosphotransferase (APT) family kinase protein
MHFIHLRGLLDGIFRDEPGLGVPIEGVEFIHRHHTDVYRVRAGGATYIAHVTPESREYLRRVRDNLLRVAPLQEQHIPRVVAWREAPAAAPAGREWAALLCTEIPGEELSRRSYSTAAWTDLSRLLRRIHGLPGRPDAGSADGRRIYEANAFPAFADTMLLRLRLLPLRQERVRRHLTAMAQYVTANASSFDIPLRLIHGDVNRSNVVIQDGQAGLLDWAELGVGDYAFDLAMLKYAMDSVAPQISTGLLQRQACEYREQFQDETLELRLRFFLALPGLSGAFFYASQPALFTAARAWRVRMCYLHSEAQWQAPLRLEGPPAGAPAVHTEHWALNIPKPLRGVFFVLAPKRVP